MAASAGAAGACAAGTCAAGGGAAGACAAGPGVVVPVAPVAEICTDPVGAALPAAGVEAAACAAAIDWANAGETVAIGRSIDSQNLLDVTEVPRMWMDSQKCVD